MSQKKNNRHQIMTKQKKQMFKYQIPMLAGLIFLSACSSSPMGRKQVLIFSEQDVAKMGIQSFEALKKKEKIDTDAKTNAYVQCVANTITKYVPAQSSFKDWEVVVFDSKEVNAFALPGGKIGVYTGLLKVADGQDQLATVIGHEISHVLAHHSNEQMSRSEIANSGLAIGSIAMSGSSYGQIATNAIGAGIQYGILLPYGRAQESEADLMGLELMAKAGFDPNQSIKLWQNMSKASGSNPPELLSTHPSDEHRIEDLRAYIQKLPPSSAPRPNCHL